MTAQERLISVLDEVLTEEIRADAFELQQMITEVIEWIIDLYEIETDESIDRLVEATDHYLAN